MIDYESSNSDSESDYFVIRKSIEEDILHCFILEKYCKEFFDDQRFVFLQLQTVQLLIQSDFCSIDECYVWETILKWSQYQFNEKKRQMLILFFPPASHDYGTLLRFRTRSISSRVDDLAFQVIRPTPL